MRAGDRDAFGGIVARYQPLVCSLAYSACGNLARSEDLGQEAFLIAWRDLEELRDPTKLRSWLCGIVRNLTANAMRRAAEQHGPQAVAFTVSSPSTTARPWRSWATPT